MKIDIGTYKTKGGWEADVYAFYPNVSTPGPIRPGYVAVHRRPKGVTTEWHHEDGTPHYFNDNFSLIERV
jgi:hypothetical protein